jgi:hypothetical protein
MTTAAIVIIVAEGGLRARSPGLGLGSLEDVPATIVETGYWHPSLTRSDAPPERLRRWLVPLEDGWYQLRRVWARPLERHRADRIVAGPTLVEHGRRPPRPLPRGRPPDADALLRPAGSGLPGPAAVRVLRAGAALDAGRRTGAGDDPAPPRYDVPNGRFRTARSGTSPPPASAGRATATAAAARSAAVPSRSAAGSAPRGRRGGGAGAPGASCGRRPRCRPGSSWPGTSRRRPLAAGWRRSSRVQCSCRCRDRRGDPESDDPCSRCLRAPVSATSQACAEIRSSGRCRPTRQRRQARRRARVPAAIGGWGPRPDRSFRGLRSSR